jgi:hypothetical protein
MNTEDYCKKGREVAKRKATMLEDLPDVYKENTLIIGEYMYSSVEGTLTIKLPQRIWDVLETIRQDTENGVERTSELLEEIIINLVEKVLMVNSSLELALAFQTITKLKHLLKNEDETPIDDFIPHLDS